VFINSPLLVYLANKFINYLFNFPDYNCALNINNIILFNDRNSDYINEQGIIIIIKGIFARWIKRFNIAILNARRA
jgi:hypothetical protein